MIRKCNNLFILQNLATCFGPYGPSSGDNYRNDIQYVLFLKIHTYWMSLRQLSPEDGP
jgi:hypothetical protein